MRAWLLLFFLCQLAAICPAADVKQVIWKTRHAVPPPHLAKSAADMLPAFRLALVTLPESSIVALALSQPPLLGLTPAQASSLRPRVASRYALMAKSAVYSQAPSALPYCFSEKRPETGLALMHVPEGSSQHTPVILFLHGYGGSFLWYQHLLAEHFPDHLIICPAYGINTASIAQEYVVECLNAAAQKLGHGLRKPSLMGLSAGGTGACSVYTRLPTRFDRMISLGSYPPTGLLAQFPRDGRALFMAGETEFFVSSGDFGRRVTQVRALAPRTDAWIVPGADHFFLLTHADATMEKLREWLR